MDNQVKFYSQKAISVATVVGGPLAAGVLIYHNFKTLNKRRQAVNSLIIGTFTTIIILAAVFMLPEGIIDKVPNILFPLIYSLIVYLIVERPQGEELEAHKQKGGQFYSSWRGAGIGALSIAVLFAGVFGAIYLTTPSYNFDTEMYDNEIEIFTRNEKKALQVFSLAEGTSDQRLLRELTIGLELWKKNRDIVERLSATENLPAELVRQNQLLQEYALLRIIYYEYIIRAIEEDSNAYESQI
ncbi:MAG TPA: hypothetical protein PLC17_00105, partial [Tenuifilaceae bacterium]|nr:hypothetical protein [Tenuifilaceae bacterium]